MKNYIICAVMLVLCLNFNPTLVWGQAQAQEVKENIEKDRMSEKLLRHIVLIKFKENTTSEEITKVQEAFSTLPDKISVIKDYEWGINNSPEGLNKGFTHGFLLTFASEEDRAVYLPHPSHQAFGKILEPHAEDVLVFDYWANIK